MANVKAGCSIKISEVQDRKRTGRKSWRPAIERRLSTAFSALTTAQRAGTRVAGRAIAQLLAQEKQQSLTDIVARVSGEDEDDRLKAHIFRGMVVCARNRLDATNFAAEKTW